MGARVRDLSAKPACRAVPSRDRRRRAGARAGRVGARDGRGSREPREDTRADRGGLRAPASKSRIARRRRRCGRCTPRSTTCRRAPPRPAVLPVRAPPRRRRLRAGAGSSTPRTCCSRRRSAACSAGTPLRRRSSGVAVARHGRDDPARPIGFRRPPHETVRAEGRLRAGPRETRAEMSRDARRLPPRLRADLTRSRRRPRTSSRRRTPRAPRCLTSTRTGRRRPGRCQTRSPRSSAFLRSDSSAGTPRLRFAQTFHVRRAIFLQTVCSCEGCTRDPSLWRAPLDISATRRFLRVRCRESRAKVRARLRAEDDADVDAAPRRRARAQSYLSIDARAGCRRSVRRRMAQEPLGDAPIAQQKSG